MEETVQKTQGAAKVREIEKVQRVQKQQKDWNMESEVMME